MSGSIFLSRILGALREAALSRLAGAGSEVDAYRAAFVIPDVLNYMLAGGALSIALLPMYSRVRSREGEEAAETLLATVLGCMTCIVVVATALLMWQADTLVAYGWKAFDPETQALTTRLTRIVLPGQIFFVVGGILQAVLFSHDRFRAAALAPLVYSVCVIAGGVGLAPWLGVEGFAWGTVVGAFLGPFLLRLVDVVGSVKIRFRVNFRDRRFREYILIAAPLMLGASLLTVDEWIIAFIAPMLGEGSLAHLAYGRKLMLVPVGMVGQAISVAALPTLARFWNENRTDEMNALVLRCLQAGVGVAMFFAMVLYGFAQPIVTLFYQGGLFKASDSASVIPVLQILSCAIPAWVLQTIAVRAFYAREEMWRPMLLGVVFVMASIPLYLLLGERHGIEGLAMAGVIGMNANALATLIYARLRHGAPSLIQLVSTSARSFVIAAIAMAAGLLVVEGFSSSLENLTWVWRELLTLLLGGGAFAIVAIGVSARFGDPALKELVQRGVRKVSGR
ncbi:MAG: murein biosynthesis integral membrane protein MurJ [Deltaproteobacteria bacterium]|nr:murein biosynthesis integral membrane protein MurJ [Deltaproteobacteria bacterium]